MTDRHWRYERGDATVGPFRVEELRHLLQADLIGPETILIGPDGGRVRAADILQDVTVRGQSTLEPRTAAEPIFEAYQPPSVPPPPPPPPPPPGRAPAHPPVPFEWQSLRTPPQPWNPQAVAWLGLFFSPVWVGIMAAVNARRLQMDEPAWRPVMIGVGSLVLYLLVSSLLFDVYLVNLGLYVGAVWLIWIGDLQPQVEAYRQRPEAASAASGWLVPAVAGTPALVLVLLAFVVVPLLPPVPPEVCEQFMQASTAQQKKRLTTTNLWPALDALEQLHVRPGTVTHELTGEGHAPPEMGGYLVSYRTHTQREHGSETVEGVLHLVDRDGRWKIEEWYVTAVDGEPLHEPAPMSAVYKQILLAQKPHDIPAARSPTTGPSLAERAASEAGKHPQALVLSSRIFNWLSEGGYKRIGSILAAIAAGLAACGRALSGGSKP